MTPLGAALIERIARSGPLTVADFMAAALTDANFGYYTRAEPFGASGDFVTAPEISQMFGEVIAAWCIDVFEKTGAPERFHLIELGPGRGTLMADLWRAAKIRPAFRAAARVHLIETSPRLREIQKAALSGVDVRWHAEFMQAAETARAPLIVIANEFFDALPVHQLVRTVQGWRERLVTYDAEADAFVFAVSDTETEPCTLVPAALRDAAPGAIFEVSPAGRALMNRIAEAVVSCGGAALVIDYGHVRSGLGDTLQSVRAHRYHDALADPGMADITAHVNFESLAAVARESGAFVPPPTTQGDFLRQLGIEARAEALCARAGAAQSQEIRTALARLIDADKMGRLFKVLAAARPGLFAAGFDDRTDGLR